MTDTAMVPRKSEGQDPARPALIDEHWLIVAGQGAGRGRGAAGPDGLLSQVKAVLERALAEEMTAHLGYEKHDPAGRGRGNSRNGSTGKTLLTDVGAVDLAVPRDRAGSFARRSCGRARPGWRGSTSRIIALYARGHDDPRHPGAPARDV